MFLGINTQELYPKKVYTEVEISIKNLPSLTKTSLYGSIYEEIVRRVLDQVQHIQELHISNVLSYFSLDNLVNLRVFSLFGRIDEKFNFELFKSLSNRLEDITISLYNIDDEKTLFKLFDGYNFPDLVNLTIKYLYMKRLTKEFINRLPKPRNELNLNESELEAIENDSFSNMQHLNSLNLSRNKIKLIEKNAFSNLKNLQILDLSRNRLSKIDRKFIGLGNSVEVKIKNNDF